MRLLMSPASPFVRKVRVAAAERGLLDRIENVPMNPHDRAAELVEANPVSKVPTLIADDGTAHADSLAICIYLDTLGDAPKMVPLDGADGFAVLRRHAWANGAMESLVACRGESQRPEAGDRAAFIAKQMATVGRVLDRFEATTGELDHVAVDTIALAAALGYADFRFPDHDWRGSRPALAAWAETFSSRPSMQRTRYA